MKIFFLNLIVIILSTKFLFAEQLVRQAQSYLLISGFDVGNVDGIKGPKTIKALKKAYSLEEINNNFGNEIVDLVQEGKISKEKLNKIVDRTKKGGAEIVKFLEKGSAFYAPAASGVEMAESYLKDLKKQLPCASYLNGEYGLKDIYVGVPVIIGKNGVEKVVEIPLTEKEKKDFKYSVDSVKELFNAAKKIDSSLA